MIENKLVEKKDCIYDTVNDGTFTFELWPSKFNNDTLNFVFSPEVILTVGDGPTECYSIGVYYLLTEGTNMLELKALKLYFSTLKNMKFSKYQDVLTKVSKDINQLSKSSYIKIELKNGNFLIGESIKGENSLSSDFFNLVTKYKRDTSKEIKVSLLYREKAIQGLDEEVPTVLDYYVLSNIGDISEEDRTRIHTKIKEYLFISKDKTYELPGKLVDIIKEDGLFKDFEVILDFNIRGGIKKVFSSSYGDVKEIPHRDNLISYVQKRFLSYT